MARYDSKGDVEAIVQCLPDKLSVQWLKADADKLSCEENKKTINNLHALKPNLSYKKIDIEKAVKLKAERQALFKNMAKECDWNESRFEKCGTFQTLPRHLPHPPPSIHVKILIDNGPMDIHMDIQKAHFCPPPICPAPLAFEFFDGPLIHTKISIDNGSIDIHVDIQKAHMGIHGICVWISIGRSYASQNFWWVETGFSHVMFPAILLSHPPTRQMACP